MKKLGLGIAGGLVMALASVLGGCAVHSQAPIKEVAYDFSDSAYYDRPFGTSPSYETADAEAGHDKKAKSAGDLVAFPCNKELEGDEEVTCYFHHKKGKGGDTESDVRIETEGDAPAPAAVNVPPARTAQPAPAAPPPVVAPQAAPAAPAVAAPQPAPPAR